MFADKATLWIIKICAGLALCVVAYLWVFNRGADSERAKQAKVDAKAAVIARATENALHGVIYDVAYAAQESRLKREKQTAVRVACLLDGTCRMRDRFSCPRVPGAAEAATLGYDPAAFGLQIEDGIFLVREANRADGVADQLRDCQAVVQAYWKATQP